MEYRVVNAYWLDQAVDQVRSFLLMPERVLKTWTIESLQSALANIGVHYTTVQLEQIGAELVRRGIIEAVA